MTGLELWLLLAAVAWVATAPDEHTLAARSGTAGAARAGLSAAGQRARNEWAAGGPVRQARRTARQARMAQTRTGRAGLALGRLLGGLGRAIRSGGRIAAAAATAAPAGYRAGAGKAVQQRRDRRQARRTQTNAPGEPDPTGEGLAIVDPTPTTPDATTPTTTSPEPAAAGAGADGMLVDLPGFGPLRVDTGPPRTPYEAGLTPRELAEFRRLKAIRASGYTGGLDQDLRPVPGLNGVHPATTTGDTTTDGTTAGATGAGTSSTPDDGATTTTPMKETPTMAEVTEFLTTDDLRAETAELEGLVEEIHAARDEFMRRCQAMAEKVGAAPFGTKAIAESAEAVSEATTTDEAAEALLQLRQAVAATGNVEAFAAS